MDIHVNLEAGFESGLRQGDWVSVVATCSGFEPCTQNVLCDLQRYGGTRQRLRHMTSCTQTIRRYLSVKQLEADHARRYFPRQTSGLGGA